MQLGFVIDHAKCIGCHACTVACKSENDVPLGSFRTWVKYVETGSFPAVRRSFAVLRCNQCTAAPCVTICPVQALEKRKDGIVDVDPRLCIGCKGCMQACPYDALYIHPEKGTAEKCHFCAHRTEVGLAPACAVVCPTEAIIPGDFHDPQSLVSRLKAGGELRARKVEAGTVPNVWYREAAPAAIDPLRTSAAGGFLWSERLPGPQLDAEAFRATGTKAEARTVYDVAHPPLWGGKVTAYLFTKSIAAGAFLAGALAAIAGGSLAPGGLALALALAFLGATTALLVADLKRPERFLYILKHPNWDSWIAKGAIVLMAYGGLLALWGLLAVLEVAPPAAAAVPLLALTAVAAGFAAAYTAALFGQAKGRPLWMKRGFAVHLVAQALVAGCALLLLVAGASGGAGGDASGALRLGLALGLGVHLALVLAEGRMAPPGRKEEYRRAHDLLVRGPYARRHWFLAVGLGGAALALTVVTGTAPASVLAGALALVALYVYEDAFVRAGQALPIS